MSFRPSAAQITETVARLNRDNVHEPAPASMRDIRNALAGFAPSAVKAAVLALVGDGALVAEYCAGGCLATNYTVA